MAVDGHSSSIECDDYNVNILSLIEFKDMALKEKNVMVLEASNSIAKGNFKEYVNQLKNQGKAGVAMNSQHLMYVMAKSPEADLIEPINEDELLVVLEKANSLTMIKDKLIKCEELP